MRTFAAPARPSAAAGDGGAWQARRLAGGARSMASSRSIARRRPRPMSMSVHGARQPVSPLVRRLSTVHNFPIASAAASARRIRKLLHVGPRHQHMLSASRGSWAALTPPTHPFHAYAYSSGQHPFPPSSEGSSAGVGPAPGGDRGRHSQLAIRGERAAGKRATRAVANP